MAPRRLLSPAFVEAVRNAPLPRHVQARLVGYGGHPCNLSRDLTRRDGTPWTPLVRKRMAELARLCLS